MYKVATDLSQRRGRQLWLADLKARVDWDSLPDVEKRANLVAAKNALHKTILTLSKIDPRRSEIGQQMHLLDEEIHAIRPKIKGPKDVPFYFIEVARERLPKPQFTIWMHEASIRALREEEGKS